MTKAAEKGFGADDEEGVAERAARLGADGGPMLPIKAARNAASIADFDEALDDDAWLEEDLSDEELAALEDDMDYGGALEDGREESELGDEAFDGLTPSDVEAYSDDAEDDFDDSFDAEDGETHGLLGTHSETDDDALEDEHFAALDDEAHGAVAARKDTSPEDPDFDAFDDENDEGGVEVEDDHDLRQVPRISIHCFCETALISGLLEKASADRRLGKTHITIHTGGLAKAVDHFQTTATPNLIIVEAIDGGPALFGRLGELAQVCDPSTKVIIIGRINDIALYRELIRQGVSEYVVKPRTPLQIIRAISTLYVDPSAPPIGKTIAFVGARGGVGSSTIAHNVGWCAAEEYKSSTIILDLDLPFGTASLDFEQDPTSGLIEALTSPERLDDVLLDRLLQKHTEHLSLFTAPNLLDRDYDLDEQAFETVIEVVRGAAPTVIVDVPHVWTAWSKKLLQTADEIVITAAPDLASFRNTKNLVDVIAGARPNDTPPKLVLNQFDAKASSVQAAQYVEHVGLTPAAVIGWEPQLFHTAATNAAPVFSVGPKSKPAAQLRELSSLVLGRAEPRAAKAKFSLASLFSTSKR